MATLRRQPPPDHSQARHDLARPLGALHRAMQREDWAACRAIAAEIAPLFRVVPRAQWPESWSLYWLRWRQNPESNPQRVATGPGPE